jgi:flagellar hook-associated protein 2
VANAIDGIGTINVSQLVSQLMSLEGRQQAQLQSRRSGEQATLAAYQQLNANLLNVRTTAESIIGSALAPRTWSALTCTTSSSSVAASTSSSALPGTYGVDVLTVATAQKVLYDGAADLTTTVCTDPVTITRSGGAPVALALAGDHTLSGLVAAINSTAGLGVKALLIQSGAGAYRLQVASDVTGAAAQFTIGGLDPALGSPAVVTSGTDASVKFGPGVGDVASSSTNTFASLFPGVSFTVSKPETGVTLTVAADSAGMSKQVQGLVDAMNSTLTSISAQSAYAPASKSGGPLTGDLLGAQVSSSLTGSVFPPGGGSLASVGVQTARSGGLVFDAAKFTSALASDPDGTKAMISALAVRVASFAESATRSGTGLITSAIDGRQAEITSLGQSISDWDRRLSAKKDQLTQQFSALNTALSSMNDQASWLSGQLSKLSAG